MDPIISSFLVAAAGAFGIRVLRQVDSLHDKVDSNSGRLERIEGRLGNGLASELRKMNEVDDDVRGLRVSFERFVREDFMPFRENVEDHITNEEERIMEFCKQQKKEDGA